MSTQSTATKKAPAKKAPAKKAAASSSAPSKPGHGDVVTWEVEGDNGAVETLVGVLVEDGLPLGTNDEGKDQGKGARVAVLTDLRVIDPKSLKKL